MHKEEKSMYTEIREIFEKKFHRELSLSADFTFQEEVTRERFSEMESRIIDNVSERSRRYERFGVVSNRNWVTTRYSDGGCVRMNAELDMGLWGYVKYVAWAVLVRMRWFLSVLFVLYGWLFTLYSHLNSG